MPTHQFTRLAMTPLLLVFLASSSASAAVVSWAEYETMTWGDLNQDGAVNVVDVQCNIKSALWLLDDELLPAPNCLGESVWTSDLDCDAVTDITDVLLTMQLALDFPMNESLDQDGDGAADTCALNELCAEGACDAIFAFDMNGDGDVSAQEWFTSSGFLPLLDDNEDGVVSSAEYADGIAPSEDTGGETGGPDPGGAPSCSDNYDAYGFPKVWDTDPSTCAPAPDDPSDACALSFDQFCDADGDGVVDPDKEGAGVTLCGLQFPCTGGSDGETGGGETGGGTTGGDATGGDATGGGTTGGGTTGGGTTGGGTSDVCSDNYDSYGFPKVSSGDPSSCIPAPGDPADACQSLEEFCDADGDGKVDDDKNGAGVTLCYPANPCDENGFGGTPSSCACTTTQPAFGGTPASCPCLSGNQGPEQPPSPPCIEVEPTSPPPPDQGFIVPPPQGACDFYGKFLQKPGGCSESETALLGGYNQICLNVTNGLGPLYCGLMDKWRQYVDGMRYCLQKEASDAIAPDGCLLSGFSCGYIVQQIIDAHAICNAQQNFCDLMTDEDTAYCFGLALGNAWGPLYAGTGPLGPLEPLGMYQTLTSILTCGLDVVTVQDNICDGFLVGCLDAVGTNVTTAALCYLSCPPADTLF